MNASTLVIISGASRGLGEAMAQVCLKRGATVVALARNDNPGLAALAQEHGSHYHFIPADLADSAATARACAALAAAITPERQRCLLINNAGNVQPVANTADLQDGQAIAAALALNVGSVMQVCAAVLTACREHGLACRILNISSGAGRNPVAGWGVYGAAKAALDFHSRVLALEHPDVPIVALAPGVVDTGMQADIRAADLAAFPGRARFIELHERGELAPAAGTAERIIAYAERDDFGTTVIDDIRHYS